MNRSIIAGVLIASAAAMPATASAQLTVYSSLPLSGAARGQTQAVNDGARQALQEAGGVAAGQAVRLVTLNDATRQAGNWTPERVSRNSRRVANDDSSVAVIGAFNSGASALAIPIMSEAGVAMISPVQHGDRTHDRRAGELARRARQVLPRGRSHLLPSHAQ